MDKYFCILGGGGIRGASYIGAIKALLELKIQITGYAGSSIGALVAGLLTFSYTLDEIEEAFNSIDFDFFKDINLNIGKDFALSKGKNFYIWVKNKLEAKFYELNPDKPRGPVKFKDLDKELIIFSVDLNNSKFFEFSEEKTPDMEVAHAIRVSCAMPGLYSPIFNEDVCLCDGDLLKSMPYCKVSETISKKEEKILEFRLEANEEKKKITNTKEYLNAVYDTVSGFASDFVINVYKNCEKYDFIKINLDGISVVDFMISNEKKLKMAKIGYETTIDYFKNKYPKKREKFSGIYKKINFGILKIIFLIKQNDITEAEFEILSIIADLITEKEIIDKNLLSKILIFKKMFDESKVFKKGLFKKSSSLINKNEILNMAQEINSIIEDKTFFRQD